MKNKNGTKVWTVCAVMNYYQLYFDGDLFVSSILERGGRGLAGMQTEYISITINILLLELQTRIYGVLVELKISQE